MAEVRIPFNRPYVVGEEFGFIQAAIREGQLSGDGAFTRLCNELIVKETGASAALLTHSCTAALEMAALLCDIGPGDEVIMPSFTFVSMANAVVLRGATPVFVDIDPVTLNIDPGKVAAAVTPRTRAIFVVHYAGFPADMDRLAEIAAAHDLFLVEDAAHAYGSSYKGRPVGSLGDLATFSFHETKNVTSGEGGALALRRADLVARAEIIREKGTNRTSFTRGEVDAYRWVDVGSSFLPGELMAAFLYAQLRHAGSIRQKRLALFERYAEAFRDLEAAGRVGLPHASDDCAGNGHMFYLLMRDRADQDAFIAHMREAGIVTPFHYVPLHSSPAGRRFGRSTGDLPVTNDTAERLVRLPMFAALDADIEVVIEAARASLRDRRAA
ncbi:dTDP-4-amino-4,6-dideoxygalactose transaminase [Oricola sp.]|uniref:dTDP-4-amino-4,6-dideoxygalactose transaminase n=1 Tax=Oricola sp. TaxID=1979950 RepID=UPI0025FEC1B1|nr:dTDP-4-amino-4,6-dideoxygalactose transaminase [Oricola sp.]MCI5074717.1 dTDP-4-amino-4,6-dideoxygalactose transaminase [Oricola sp.]